MSESVRTRKHKRIAWLYDGDHLQHPFICAGIESLIKTRSCTITLIDRAPQVKTLPYQHHTTLSLPFNFYGFSLKWVAGFNTFLQTIRLTLSARPHIIITTHPSNLIVGWLASNLLHARLVYYSFELYGEEYGETRWIWQQTERFVISHSIDALVTQNEERAKVFLEERGARVAPTIVHNYKSVCEMPSPGKLRAHFNLPSDCPLVLYEGALIQGRWLENLVQSALYLQSGAKLVFLGGATSWWRKHIRPILLDPKVGQKVKHAPAVPHSEILDYIVDADVGVIIYDDKVRNNYFCEPGKLSDYVLAGIPVVAPNFPTLASVIHRYDIGVVFTSPEPEKIAEAINQVLSEPKERWRSSLQRARQELIWETQESKFLLAVFGE